MTEPINTLDNLGAGETATFTISVDASCFPIQRVALLSPASATHAFDFNQRYVEQATPLGVPSGPTGTLEIQRPEDNYVTPPGYYYLIIIDNQGAPSIGRWVRISAAGV